VRNLWKKIDDGFETWLMVACYGYLVLIILAEVVRRHLFGASSEWGEMTARYAFVFVVYIAMAEIARNRNHIRIDLVPQLLGARKRLFLYLYFDFLHLVLVVLTVYYGLNVMRLQIENEVLMTGLDLNMAFAQAALPIAFFMLGYRVIQRSIRMIKHYQATGKVELGGGNYDDQ